jgi:FixJ family two-component response regulator
VVTGVLNRQIAAELVIAENRVKVHRGPVMEEMRAGSFAEWARLGGKRGVISARS